MKNPFSTACCLLALASIADAASITLTTTDNANTSQSSFNTAGNWSNAAAPSAANDYFVSISFLRTPYVANYTGTFGGNSLTLNASGAMIFKGSGANVLTINNFILNGGTVRSGSSGSDTLTINGTLSITGSDSVIQPDQCSFTINSPISGTGSFSSTVTTGFTATYNGVNTYTGTMTCAGAGTTILSSSSSWKFAIGASGTNNAISGSGILTLNGTFNPDLTSAGTTIGNSWTLLASTLTKTYSSSFNVSGFTVSGATAGSRTWLKQVGSVYYQFVESTGILSVVSNPDTDGDGLLDSWEVTYFGSITAQDGSGDPDGDGYTNLQEFNATTTPTISNIGDSDLDDMKDSWETTYFGSTTAQPASGDYDDDGYTNLQEYQGGSNPTNANSIPGDTDGDNLPDTWENANMGNLTTGGAYDDTDGDGYTNLAEMQAGTNPLNANSHPSWVSPRVAFLKDSVITSGALLMPSTATYGRAINGVSFQTRALLTYDGYQYSCFYNTSGTTQKLYLARRTVSSTTTGAWESFDTGSEFTNGDESVWDAHNVISLGICPADGTLHFSWDMHGNTLRYRRSVTGLVTTNKSLWSSGASALLAEQNWLVNSSTTVSNVTYPMFINTPSGTLMFQYRVGNTTAGDHYFNTYLPASGNWSASWKFHAKEGSYTGMNTTGSFFTSTSRNPYENNFDFGPDGTLHHTWTYRETNNANHDIYYAYSTDNGVTWKNNTGTIVANTATGGAIRVDSTGIRIKALDSRQRLINQQSQCVDGDGRVHVLMLHRRAESDAAWVSGESVFSVLKTAYHHYFRDPATGTWYQRRIPHSAYPVGTRPKIVFDSNNNVYAIYLSYASTTTDVVPGYIGGTLVIASASKASNYTDWSIVQTLSTALNGEPIIDQARLTNDKILSVFIQEDSTNTSYVATPLHAYEFAVDVPQTTTTSIGFWGQDVLVNLPSVVGKTYQLQTSTDLSNWTSVGSSTSGIGTMLALPHANGATDTKRFYRVQITP